MLSFFISTFLVFPAGSRPRSWAWKTLQNCGLNDEAIKKLEGRAFTIAFAVLLIIWGLIGLGVDGWLKISHQSKGIIALWNVGFIAASFAALSLVELIHWAKKRIG